MDQQKLAECTFARRKWNERKPIVTLSRQTAKWTTNEQRQPSQYDIQPHINNIQ